MLKVELKTIKDVDTQNKEVNIKVLLNIPQVAADIFAGFVFTNAPAYVLSEIQVPFSTMKKTMDTHELENWIKTSAYLEDMYTKYFTALSNFTLFVKIMKEEDPISQEKVANIKVYMSIPSLAIDEEKGFVFGETPSNCVSQTTISFADMQKVLKHYKIFNWKQAKSLLEQKYSQFFVQVFQDWLVGKIG